MTAILHLFTTPVLVLLALGAVEGALFLFVNIEISFATIDMSNRLRSGQTIEEALESSPFSDTQLSRLCRDPENGQGGYVWSVSTTTSAAGSLEILGTSCRYAFSDSGVVASFGGGYPAGGFLSRSQLVQIEEPSS
ncbi:hypothetical protein [Citreimonas salinaria]|uniref:Uncharacterized protein n=1 Tax=Citreimonas salinaria TaxID=321339 RepID=A0A1H3LZY4_9RHOB|nr:hypothetical protein [Citreimonas salinaria]SDY70021.1 hypothetical protein SAMN05444340_11529 [Citreimonas salinaria]